MNQQSYLKALRDLQEQAQTITTVNAAEALLADLLRQRLAIESAVLCLDTATCSDATIAFPLPNTRYQLCLQRRRPFNSDELNLVQVVAGIIANAPYFKEDAVAVPDEQDVRARSLLLTLRDIHRHLIRTFKATISYIALYDPELEQITFPCAYRDGHYIEFKPISLPNKDSLAAWVLTNQEPYITGNWQAETGPVAGIQKFGPIHSIIAVPMVADGEIMGVISIQSELKDAFNTAEGQSLKAIADHVAVIVRNARPDMENGEATTTIDRDYQTAVAIEHAHLFSQAQRRAAELSAFHEIALRLNTPLNLNVVLDTITEAALKLIDATNVHIFLYDEEANEFSFGSARWRDGRRESAVDKPRKTGLTATVVHEAEPVVINNAREHPLFQSETADSWGIHAIAGFPLKHVDEVMGAFTVTYLQPHTFNEEEMMLLNLLADQAAVAVRNARLFSQSQRRLRDMSALVDMAKQVTRDLKLQPVLQTTVQSLQGLLNARASTITMLNDEREALIVEAAAGVNPEFLRASMRLDESISGRVVQTGELMYISDTYEEPDFLFFDDVVRSLLVVPLVIRDEVVGTLTVDSANANHFSESDLQLMTIAAAQVSIAIANARLFEELEERATELEEAYEELKESDRLKDELVQNLSHELRTPLTFVKGYVDLMMDGEMGLMALEQQEALLIVSEKTNEITRLIDDIMTLQRIDSGNLAVEPNSMAELIRTAVASHRLVADKKGLRVVHTTLDSPGIVLMDKGRVNQVLDNLIGNAMKFSPDGGTIHVSMVEREDDVLVAVADEGIGLPADKRERVFERFYQVDGSSRRRFGGTGLGLAIVRRIVDAHDGTIWVESQLNKGSVFYFTLPKAQQQQME